eukprot:jgi/Psemu1/30235/gm1.30235_g
MLIGWKLNVNWLSVSIDVGQGIGQAKAGHVGGIHPQGRLDRPWPSEEPQTGEQCPHHIVQQATQARDNEDDFAPHKTRPLPTNTFSHSPAPPVTHFFMAHHIRLQALPPSPALSQHNSPTGLTAATHTNTPLAHHTISTSPSAALRLSSPRPALGAAARPSADAGTPHNVYPALPAPLTGRQSQRPPHNPPPPPHYRWSHNPTQHSITKANTAASDTFAISSVAPKNTLSGFGTWTDATLLPDDFASADGPVSQVGSGPLDHNGSANTIP